MGYPSQVAARVEAFMNSTTRRTLVVSGIVGVLMGGATLVAEDWMLHHVWHPAFEAARRLADQKMGYGFALAFACLVLSVLLAFVDTSPIAAAVASSVRAWRRGSAPEPEAIPLSADDRHAIAALRTLWHDRGGQELGFLTKYLLEMCQARLKEKYYVSLYTTVINNLGEKGGALDAVFAFNPPQPLEHVTATFEQWFQALLRGAELLYDADQQKDIDLSAPELLKQFSKVRTAYEAFMAGVIHANNYQGVDRQLRVFAMPGTELSSRKFFGEQIWNGPSPLDRAGATP